MVRKAPTSNISDFCLWTKTIAFGGDTLYDAEYGLAERRFLFRR